MPPDGGRRANDEFDTRGSKIGLLLTHTIRYLPAQIIGPIVQVIATLAWTYWLAPAPYGLLTLLIAAQELVFLLGLAWWTHYTMRYLGGFEVQARRDFERSEAPVFVASFLVQTLITLAIVGSQWDQASWRLALAAIAYSTTRTLMTHLGERARVQGRIAVYTGGQVFGSLIGFVFAYGAVARVSATPESVLWGYAVAQSLGLTWMWRALGLQAGGLRPNRAVVLAALRYGAPLLAAGGFNWLAQNAIRLVVEPAAGATALGLIAVGWGLGQRLAVTLSMLVVSASFPLALQSLHSGSREGAFRQLALGGSLLMGLMIPATLGFSLLAQPFATLFVAAPFRETTILILPLAAAVGTVRNIRMHIADPVFLLIERPRINTAINVVDTLFAFAGCGIGLHFGGLVGTATGALVGTGLSTLVGFVLARRIAGFSLPLGDMARICAASLVMACVLFLVPWSSLPFNLMARMVAEICLGATVYALAIALLFPSLFRLARDRAAAARG